MMLQDELKSQLAQKMTFADLVKTIDGISDKTFVKKTVKIGYSSNVVVDQSQYFFKKHGFLKNIECLVQFGDYQTQFPNVQRFVQENVDVLILQNVFDNIQPSFESQLLSLDAATVSAIHDGFFAELGLCLEAARGIKQVVLDRFFLLTHLQSVNPSKQVMVVLDQFNLSLSELALKYPNCVIVDPQPLISAGGGAPGSINLRYYYHFKAPFSLAYWDHYAKEVLLASRYGQSFFYKVLVLDCDNTLWGGIVGEDLLQGIKLDPASYPGNVFWRVQNEILSLQAEGVLLCLCSKNNPGDVDQVIEQHPFQVLKNQHFVFKKVNWQSKVENLKALAQELNLGLDSFIFVDDSDFEINSVRDMLPDVLALQVPKNLYEYPSFFAEIRKLFVAGGLDSSSRSKTEQYRLVAQAAVEKAQFSNFEDYIKSLEIKVRIDCNNLAQVGRIAELTQKSNQFNLTTRRYTEAEVIELMNSDASDVFSISVADKFGNSGLTGIAVVRTERPSPSNVEIDNFLMSCRVIGRTIEYSCWKPIFNKYLQAGFKTVSACFKPTAKNAQVRDYFETLGLALRNQVDEEKNYEMPLSDIPLKYSNHIEVICDF